MSGLYHTYRDKDHAENWIPDFRLGHYPGEGSVLFLNSPRIRCVLGVAALAFFRNSIHPEARSR